jgi:hypothetical protein
MNILLVGAGQLGSRHLQSLKKCETPNRIYVVDPSKDSLQVAQARFEQIETSVKHEASYHGSIEEIGERSFFLVIIACNSNHRYKIANEVLEALSVDFMLLEKVLFNQLDQYYSFLEIAKNSTTKMFVNCPRRIQPFYGRIGNLFSGRKFKCEVVGTEWGLACNSIHYVDFFASLIKSTQFITICNDLEPTLYPSKRAGFSEINGTLNIEFPDRSTLELSCTRDDRMTLTLRLVSERYCLEVNELQKKYKLKDLESGTIDSGSFDNFLQSDLTNIFLNEILTMGGSSLPTIEDSIAIHLNLFEPIGRFLVEKCDFQAKNQINLPFT